LRHKSNQVKLFDAAIVQVCWFVDSRVMDSRQMANWAMTMIS